MTRDEFRAYAHEILAQATSDDARIYFGNGNLSFYRPKNRGPEQGPEMIFIEFNEVYSVTLDPEDA